MLSPEELDRLASSLVAGHEEALVSELLQQLVSALFKDGELTVKDLLMLETVAANNRDALASILAKHQPRIRRTTVQAVAAALEASDADDVEKLAAYYGTLAPAGTTALFQRMSQETAEGVAAIVARQNVAMTWRAERLWYEVASSAIVDYNHGAKPLGRVMEASVRKLARGGVQTIDYASGVVNHTDVAIRRHVISQVGQASGRLTLHRLAHYGHDLVWVSGHFGARPDHAAWQGKAYSIAGAKPGYPDFYATTGYGTVTGLLGVNCRHTFGPYFPDITELPDIERERNGMDNDAYYEATQKQRGIERAIRQTKRDITALDAAGLDPAADRLKLGRQQAKLRELVADKGLVRQPVREKAYGIGVSPRALRRAR